MENYLRWDWFCLLPTLRVFFKSTNTSYWSPQWEVPHSPSRSLSRRIPSSCRNHLCFHRSQGGREKEKLMFNYITIAYFHYSRKWVKKDIAVIYVKECSMFSFRSFIMSSLTFRSLIHFEFIFLYSVRKCSNFILFHVAVQFSQYHLLKRLFYPLYILASIVIG